VVVPFEAATMANVVRGMLVLAVVAVVVALEEEAERAAERPRTEMAMRVPDALLIRLAPRDGLGAVTGAWGDVCAHDYAVGGTLPESA
jgi:hypothetical protein